MSKENVEQYTVAGIRPANHNFAIVNVMLVIAIISVLGATWLIENDIIVSSHLLRWFHDGPKVATDSELQQAKQDFKSCTVNLNQCTMTLSQFEDTDSKFLQLIEDCHTTKVNANKINDEIKEQMAELKARLNQL